MSESHESLGQTSMPSAHDRLAALANEVHSTPQGSRLTRSPEANSKEYAKDIVKNLKSRERFSSLTHEVVQNGSVSRIIEVTKTSEGYKINVRFNERVDGLTHRGYDIIGQGTVVGIVLDNDGTLVEDGSASTRFEAWSYTLALVRRLLNNPGTRWSKR